jgi:hypothetical protein
MPRVATGASFIHIPLPEFVQAWNRGSAVVGGKFERTCCPSCDSGTLEALKCAP